MKRLGHTARIIGAVAVLSGLGLPNSVQAEGIALKQGWLYSIGFPDTATLGSGVAKGVATYRVLATAGDSSWYRVRMVVRNPQGGWMTPAGAPEVWINLSYAMWVQEVLR